VCGGWADMPAVLQVSNHSPGRGLHDTAELLCALCVPITTSPYLHCIHIVSTKPAVKNFMLCCCRTVWYSTTLR
jgi:hypothetical protein